MTRFLFNVAVVLAIIFCGESAAQDSAAPNKKTGQKTSQQEISSAGEAKKENPTKKTGAEEFTDALNKWRNLHRQLQETKRQYQQAKLGDQKRLRDQYSNIITQIQLHLSTLRSAAITAYEEAPNKDENVYRLLIGMMADSNAKNMFEESLKIGRLLEKHDCPLDAYAGPLGVALFCGGDEGAAEKHLAKAKQTGKLTEFGKKVVREWELRGKEAEQKLPRVTLNTSKGKIEIVLFENEAPDTVGNFVQLVEKKFYDNLTFHRVIEGFMAQGGCPKGDGSGGPGYNIYCECDQPDHRLHFRGSLSMAHAGKDTGGSQFYIVYDRAGASHLDGRHTVFGRVVKGMDVADKLQPTGADTVKKEAYDRILTAVVDFKRDHPYLPKKSAEQSAEQGAEK